MAKLEPKEISLSEINNGNEYENGDIVDARSINSAIEASAYAQGKANQALERAISAGTSVKVNGTVQTVLNFTSDPQSQINDLKSASNFTSLWSGNWTNSNPTAKSINFSGYKYIMVRGNVGQPFCVMMAVADLTYGFTVYSPGNSNAIFAFSLKVTQNSIAWGNAGTYSNGVFQDRTNTGYYNIWEILGVK